VLAADFTVHLLGLGLLVAFGWPSGLVLQPLEVAQPRRLEVSVGRLPFGL